MKASPHADLAYLHHILEAGERILDYTQEGREAFLADRKSQDAVGRNHGYDRVDVDQVWAALETDLPPVLHGIRTALDALRED